MDLRDGPDRRGSHLLTRLAGRHEKDAGLQRLLAQALMANGQPQEAVQAFETARAADPKDPELAFLLGAAYLRSGKVDAAERCLARSARRIPGRDRRPHRAHVSRCYARYDRPA